MDQNTELVEELEMQEPSVEVPIPLEKIRFDIVVKGTLAEVKVEQEFGNKLQKSIEAIYTFPIPDEAAVVDCEMKIGEKIVKAELKEKEEARNTYEKARDEGHHASLLEQEEEDIFTMNVAGIEPGEKIVVTTTYQQRVPWQTGGGRLVVPTVVAPIFIPGTPTGQKSGTGWAEDTNEVPNASKITPHFTNKNEGEEVSYTFDIKVSLDAGFDCEVTSHSHPMLGTITGDKESPVEFSSRNLIPNRDFIICYQSIADQVASGVHRGKFNGEEFALISLVPPGNVETKPKDIIFLVDVSGSMDGIKKQGAKRIFRKMLLELRGQHPDTRFGIMAFDGRSYLIRELAGFAEKEDFANLLKKIDKVGGGGTYAGRALDECFAELAKVQNPQREQYLLMIGDGQTDDKAKNIKAGIRVISCGIDVAVREKYFRDIAKLTGGTNINIYPGEDYNRTANTLLGLLSGPVLRDLKVTNGNCDVVGIQDVYMGMPANILLRDINGDLPETITIEGLDSTGKKIQIPINLKDFGECNFAHKLWAREKVREPEMKKDEQIDLSIKYGVICKHTSFVAVSYKEIPGQKPEKVEVKVEFPEGWNYDAFDDKGHMASICMLSAHRGLDGPYEYGGFGIEECLSIEEILPLAPEELMFDMKHPVEKLDDLVHQLEDGSIDTDHAEHVWADLSKEITLETIKSWTLEQKCQALYHLLVLKSFGLDINQELLYELFKIQMPDKNQDLSAYDLWVKAMQKAGRKVS